MIRKRKMRLLAWMALAAILSVVIAVLVFVKKNRETQTGEPVRIAATTETGSNESKARKKTLIMAIEEPLDTPYGKLVASYKKNVEALSEGELSIDIYENGLLGHSDALLRSIDDDTNAADIILVPLRSLTDAGCTKTGDLLEPYSFSGHGGFLRWAASKEAQALLTEPKDCGAGVTGLFFAEDGFRYLFLKEDGEDISGRRIAGGAEQESADYVEQLGAVYDHLPSVDIKAALLDGSLDGAEQTLSFYMEDGLWEAAPYIVMDAHMASLCEAVIKLDTAEGLSDGELDILKRAGEEAVKAFTQKMEAEEKAMLEETKGHGVTTIKLRR